MCSKSVMPSNHLILCHPLLLLPSIFPSIRVFSNESALCIRWPKYWSFSFNISPSNEYSGLISFRMDWLDLLAIQGTLKSLLQHHSSKASILQCSAFFRVQLSHSYMTTGKTIALTKQTFVGKVMSLLFNMLSRLVITFLPRSKLLLISWLQSPSTVILERRINLVKSCKMSEMLICFQPHKLVSSVVSRMLTEDIRLQGQEFGLRDSLQPRKQGLRPVPGAYSLPWPPPLALHPPVYGKRVPSTGLAHSGSQMKNSEHRAAHMPIL